MHPDRLTRLHTAIDRQSGEAVRIVPFAGGGYFVGEADPDRPMEDIVALVTAVPKNARTAASGANSGHNAEIRTASHTIAFTTASLPYPLAEADQVVLLERGDLTLKVSSASPYGTGRTLARLELLPSSAS